MTLQTERVALGPQQLGTLAAVRFVADRAALTERGPVVDCLFLLIRQFGMAAQTNIDRVGLGQSGIVAMTKSAILAATSIAWCSCCARAEKKLSTIAPRCRGPSISPLRHLRRTRDWTRTRNSQPARRNRRCDRNCGTRFAGHQSRQDGRERSAARSYTDQPDPPPPRLASKKRARTRGTGLLFTPFES